MILTTHSCHHIKQPPNHIEKNIPRTLVISMSVLSQYSPSQFNHHLPPTRNSTREIISMIQQRKSFKDWLVNWILFVIYTTNLATTAFLIFIIYFWLRLVRIIISTSSLFKCSEDSLGNAYLSCVRVIKQKINKFYLHSTLSMG